MKDESRLKSAFELAMERLKKKDADAGIEARPLTDQQKAAIAEVRSFYEAQLAQADVLYRSKMNGTFNEEARELYTQEFRRDRERLIGERDSKIEKIRAGETGS